MTAGRVAHVGYVLDGQPYVIPLTYHFDPADPTRVYLHGSRDSRTLQALAAGTDATICVTHVDGLVYSRTAPNHSLNYRSAICFGRTSPILDVSEKRRVFEAMTRRYFPGREPGKDYEPAPVNQLEALTMVELAIEERSAKVRRGPPIGPRDGDPSAPGSAGVVELW